MIVVSEMEYVLEMEYSIGYGDSIRVVESHSVLRFLIAVLEM